jgi:hypothetical protein
MVWVKQVMFLLAHSGKVFAVLDSLNSPVPISKYDSELCTQPNIIDLSSLPSTAVEYIKQSLAELIKQAEQAKQAEQLNLQNSAENLDDFDFTNQQAQQSHRGHSKDSANDDSSVSTHSLQGTLTDPHQPLSFVEQNPIHGLFPDPSLLDPYFAHLWHSLEEHGLKVLPSWPQLFAYDSSVPAELALKSFANFLEGLVQLNELKPEAEQSMLDHATKRSQELLDQLVNELSSLNANFKFSTDGMYPVFTFCPKETQLSKCLNSFFEEEHSTQSNNVVEEDIWDGVDRKA